MSCSKETKVDAPIKPPSIETMKKCIKLIKKAIKDYQHGLAKILSKSVRNIERKLRPIRGFTPVHITAL